MFLPGYILPCVKVESKNMNNSKDNEDIIPPHLVTIARHVTENALPEKSKEKYLKTYDKFINWQKKENTNSFAESVLIAYFKELSQHVAPPTLWSIHSMLKTTIENKNNVDISKYHQLMYFMKRQNVGYEANKSKVLTYEEVEKFLRQAPDEKYLAIKTALIIEIYGACRGGELCSLTIDNVTDKDSILHVVIPDTKTHLRRSFVIDQEYCTIVKKYMSLRPKKISTNRFFIFYRNGKCTQQPIGKNKLSNMPSEIAEYLGLPDSKKYTGHTLRRTSATMLANAGADMMAIKRLGGWKSDRVAEGYVDDSTHSKKKRSSQLTEMLNTKPSTSTSNSEVLSANKLETKTKENYDLSSFSDSTANKENAYSTNSNNEPTGIHYHFHINSINTFNCEKNRIPLL